MAHLSGLSNGTIPKICYSIEYDAEEFLVKIQKPDSREIGYPSKKLIASLALGVALSTTACTSTDKPTLHDTTDKQIEEPENLGGIPPVEPPRQESTTQATSCDINTSKPKQIKLPSALAGKIVAPRR